jgi:hypothetical protein
MYYVFFFLSKIALNIEKQIHKEGVGDPNNHPSTVRLVPLKALKNTLGMNQIIGSPQWFLAHWPKRGLLKTAVFEIV